MKNKYPYRFKTEKEFIDEYGSNWRHGRIDCGWNIRMDYLLGKEYEYIKNEIVEDEYGELPIARVNGKSDYRWSISWGMLTKNKPKVPSYKPRKISR